MSGLIDRTINAIKNPLSDVKNFLTNKKLAQHQLYSIIIFLHRLYSR